MSDSRKAAAPAPRRSFLSPPAVALIVAAVALAWFLAELARPRITLLTMVVHGLYFAATTAGCCLGGYLLTRRITALATIERLVLGFALGLAILITVTFALGLLGLLGAAAILLAACILAAIVGALLLRRDLRDASSGAWPLFADMRPADWLIAGLAATFAAVLLYCAWGLCVKYDALEYHAGVPAEWFHAGRIIALPHNVYSWFPMATEMLYLYAMDLVGDAVVGSALGKLLAGSTTVWAALAVLCIGRRLFSLRAGLVAALLYLTIPAVFEVSTVGYVEAAQAFFLITTFAALVALFGRRSAADAPSATKPSAAAQSSAAWPLAALAGALAGAAAGVKITDLAFVVLPALVAVIIAARRLRLGWRPLVAFVLAAAVFGSPFYLRNLFLTGNPFFPVLSTFLGGPLGWTPDLAAHFARFHSPGPFTLSALRDALAGSSVADSTDTAWFLYGGAVLLAAPFAFARAQWRRAAAVLLALVVLIVAIWFAGTHRIPRLLVPAWPILAVLAGAGLVAMTNRKAVAVLIVAVVALVGLDLSVCLQSIEARALYLTMVEDSLAPLDAEGLYDFRFAPDTTGRLWTYNPWAVRRINDLHAADPSIRVGLVGEAEILYFTIPVVYNTAFNRSWLVPLAEQSSDPITPAGRLDAGLRRSRVTHLYVNWSEINRFSAEGNYGWPDWLSRDAFARLETTGRLKVLFALGRPDSPPSWVFYAVTPAAAP